MRILIMEAPGSGKGTQAAEIADLYSIPAVSTGDIFRGLHTANAALAATVAHAMATGGYVPDDITNRIVAERLALPDCRQGFVLDGYPRTLQQVGALDYYLAHDRVTLDAVVALDVHTDELLNRLTARAGTQDRPDDNAETIAVRLRMYTEQTRPLQEAYHRRGLLRVLDGAGTVEQVSRRIAESLGRPRES